MVVVFADTSALARRYLTNEPGSERVLQLAETPGNAVITSALTVLEFAAILARVRRNRLLPADTVVSYAREFGHHLASEYTVVELDRAVMDRATILVERHVLRSLDAIQVGVALRLREQAQPSFQFWTADRRQAEAAEAEGLEVVLLGADRR